MPNMDIFDNVALEKRSEHFHVSTLSGFSVHWFFSRPGKIKWSESIVHFLSFF